MEWLQLTAPVAARIRRQRILELECAAYRELLLAAELEETESPVAGAPHLAEAALGHRTQAEILAARTRVLAALTDGDL